MQDTFLFSSLYRLLNTYYRRLKVRRISQKWHNFWNYSIYYETLTKYSKKKVTEECRIRFVDLKMILIFQIY